MQMDQPSTTEYNFRCPQFVDFGSESFQEDGQMSSYEDSLVSSKHSRASSEVIDSIETSAEESNVSIMSEESKENFPVHKVEGILENCESLKPQTAMLKPRESSTVKQNLSSKVKHSTNLQAHRNVSKTLKPLSENLKRKRSEAPYVSMAEQVAAFQKKTPDRFHTTNKAFKPQEHWEPPRLFAKSPNLQAAKRRRVVNAMSKEEMEEKEVQEMKAYEFHAKPVDPKIYKHQTIKPEIRAMLKTKNFYLKTAQRAKKQRWRKSSEKEHKFKARPVPSHVLKGPIDLKVKSVPPTTARSPTFKSEARIEKRKNMQAHKEEVKVLPCNTSKRLSKNSLPPCEPWTKRRTEVCPFSFDAADKKRFLQKEKKIQAEIENEKKAHLFHAQPMPYPAPSILPSVSKKPVTEPEPFDFATCNRNPKSFKSFTEENSISFKAQPATVLGKQPFLPKKPPKQEIEIKEFNLHTNRRASERMELKQRKDMEHEQKLQAFLLKKAHEEKLEQEKLKQLRKEIVHKANPVRHYKGVEIKPSNIPMTEPKTPNFLTEKRARTKQ